MLPMLRVLNHLGARWGARSRRKLIKPAGRRRPRPSLELLEERTVPAFAIRATEFSSFAVSGSSGGGIGQNSPPVILSGANVVASSTQNFGTGPGTASVAVFSLPDFVITVVSNASTTGPGFSAHGATVNLQYNGSGTGANSDALLVEVLGDSYVNPTAGPAVITSNASPSTSGLTATNVVMTSGVLDGTVALSGTAGTTLTGQMGMTTGTGEMGAGQASSVLTPNPATGATFTIADPFTFYQTYTFAGFANTNQNGTFTAGTTVNGQSVTNGSLSGSKLLAVPTPGESCRMTGGGSVFTSAADIALDANGNPLPVFTRITHGFELHCDPLLQPNNHLEINWGGGQNFHLSSLFSDSYCVLEPGFSPNPPAADCNTFVGHGTGTLNGVAGYTIWFTFTDHGEPGSSDTAAYLIEDPHGNVVLSVGGQTTSLATPDLAGPTLTFGNQQFHKEHAASPSGGTTTQPWNPAVNGTVYVLLLSADQKTLVDHTTIDANGNFSFPSEAPGTYVIAEESPAGYTELSPSAGTPITWTTNVGPASDVIEPFGFTVTVTAGQNTAISAPFINELTPIANCRWTGGGSIFTGANDFALSTTGGSLPAGTRITHGFELHCDLSAPNNLEINWGGGQDFHLTTLTNAVCFHDPSIGGPAPPAADCNTIIAAGVGKFNGVDGYNIEFTFTDQGEPGTSDTASYLIWKDGAGGEPGVYDPGIDTLVLMVGSKYLTYGNQ
jgi:hypothetical protein